MIGIGDRVVCVDDSPCPCCGEPIVGLKLRGIYTVTGFYVDESWGGELFVQLAELPDNSSETHPDAGNWADAASFRKLNDSEDDAELIERIKSCKPAKQPVAASARSEAAAVGGGK